MTGAVKVRHKREEREDSRDKKSLGKKRKREFGHRKLWRTRERERSRRKLCRNHESCLQ